MIQKSIINLLLDNQQMIDCISSNYLTKKVDQYKRIDLLFGAPDKNKVELFSSASELTFSSLLLPL